MASTGLGAFSGLVVGSAIDEYVGLGYEEIRNIVRSELRFRDGVGVDLDVKVHREWEEGQVLARELSWDVGYGPRTKGWLYMPVDSHSMRPGILALHDHAQYKYLGKEKIAKGPEEAGSGVTQHWLQYYEGRPYVNELAARGFIVLVHDAFLWGSRRFDFESMSASVKAESAGNVEAFLRLGQNEVEATYNAAAVLHEHVVEKYCRVLGTTLAAVVSYEDRLALRVLRQVSGVDANRLGCIGLSGGGNRAALLTATTDGLAAAVVVGLMSTYAGLLDKHVGSHTWMLYPGAVARRGVDWPDVAGCAAPRPLLVQFDEDDELFGLSGMKDSDRRLKTLYESSAQPTAYSGRFYPGPHKFDLVMQEEAFDWLGATLGA